MDWYYVKAGERLGPVPAIELKRLADTGALTPNDLVWREGLTDWLAARKVKGLFDAPALSGVTTSAVGTPAEETAAAALPQTPRFEPVKGSEVGSGIGPIVPLVAPPPEPIPVEEVRISTKRKKKKPDASSTPVTPVTPVTAAVPSLHATPPAAGSLPPAASVPGSAFAPGPSPIPPGMAAVAVPPAQTAPPVGAAPSGAALPERAKPAGPPRQLGTGPHHAFDFVLDGLRGLIGPSFVSAACRMFLMVGHYGIYVMMALAVFYGVALGFKTDAVIVASLAGIAFALGLFVLQYAATRFSRALDALNASSPGRMSSTAPLDCFALLAIAGSLGLAALVAMTSLLTGQWSGLLHALAVFVLGEFMAVVALCPASVHISIAKDTSAGEEAIGLLTFFVKLAGRAAVVAYGALVLVGILSTMLALAPLFVESSWMAMGAPFSPVVPAVAGMVLPIAVYVLLLFAFLCIDVIRAVLSVARRPFEVCLPPGDEDSDTGETTAPSADSGTSP